MTFYAHSLPNRPPEEWQPLDQHLKNVAELAAKSGRYIYESSRPYVHSA